MNLCIMTGRLVRDPELKTVGQNGTQLTNFSIAVNGYKKDAPANFFECNAWGKSAELVEKYFKKGDLIQFSGSLQQQNWTQKDGTKRSKVVLNVFSLDFLPNGKKKAESNTGYSKSSDNGFVNTEDEPIIEESIPF